MTFARWTRIPKGIPDKDDRRGAYFYQMWREIRDQVEKDCRDAVVDLDDKEIGFPEKAATVQMSKSKAQERLRELYIAQKVIQLCVKSKKDQQNFERKRGKPEAYMRVISISLEESVAIGPYLKELNPQYEKKKKDPRIKKYLIKPLDKFIQMYPVEIRLECDVNTFMRFLNEVRSPGQFLVIVELEIMSPLLLDSKMEQSRSDFQAISGLEEGGKMRYPNADQHIWVRMSAAGMDFFDPEQGSIYAQKEFNKRRRTGRRPSRRRPFKAAGH